MNKETLNKYFTKNVDVQNIDEEFLINKTFHKKQTIYRTFLLWCIVVTLTFLRLKFVVANTYTQQIPLSNLQHKLF